MQDLSTSVGEHGQSSAPLSVNISSDVASGLTLKDAGAMMEAVLIEQVAGRHQDRDQDPGAVDPALQGLAHVGLEDGPVGQPAVDRHGLRGGDGVHDIHPSVGSRK